MNVGTPQSPCVTKYVVNDERKKFDDDDDGAFKEELPLPPLSHIYIYAALKFFLPAEILNFVTDSAADEKETKLSKTMMAKASRVRIEPEILCPSSK